MVLETILPSPRVLRSPSLRRQYPRNELGSWSTLFKRHRYLLYAITLLVILCTVYLYFAITLGEASDPCFGLNGPQKASCHVAQLKAEAKGKLKNHRHF